jgi:Pentapeptide repeats (8 copies)
MVRTRSGLGEVRYALGDRLVDRYLEFVAGRGMAVTAPLRDRAPHVQAAVTVLGRLRSADKRSRGWLARVDLTASDLGYSDLAGADLHYSDLSQSFILRADLRGADLTGVWFVRAVLDEARLYQADLRIAVFWRARLPGADLRAADLTGADFSGAVLRDASLDLADLRGADLSAADITGTTFRGAVADDTTTWPDGFDPQQAGVLTADEAPPLRPQKYSVDPQPT